MPVWSTRMDHLYLHSQSLMGRLSLEQVYLQKGVDRFGCGIFSGPVGEPRVVSCDGPIHSGEEVQYETSPVGSWQYRGGFGESRIVRGWFSR